MKTVFQDELSLMTEVAQDRFYRMYTLGLVYIHAHT